jgi:hypothetical protein
MIINQVVQCQIYQYVANKSPKSSISISQKNIKIIPVNHKNHNRPLEKSWRPKIQDSTVSILISGGREVEEETEQEIKLE